MVTKKVLNNGLTVLVKPLRRVPKVSLQLWYGVGSKDERSGERGIAHLIEHMIFKGTEKLSESDINVLVAKMSGSCNAFTSHDYTGYTFEVPAQYWTDVLPIMADCMENCQFHEPFLASELKAVIQELKMYNDDYASVLLEQMMSAMFFDHPYHYPVIGYKRDLWVLSRENLRAFYKKHYTPNNATLVVVGDVDSDAVLAQAQHSFGSLRADPSYTRNSFVHVPELTSRSTTIYRDVKQERCFMAWVIPGMSHKREYVYDLASWIIGSGKGSRLYQKLATKLDLVFDVETFAYDLFDYGVFFVFFEPKSVANIPKIEAVIFDEIADISAHGIKPVELARARRKVYAAHVGLYENPEKYAYMLGKMFMATGDEQYLDLFCVMDDKVAGAEIQKLCVDNFYPEAVQRGLIASFEASAVAARWQVQQAQSDQEDEKILGAIERELPVQEALFAKNFVAKKPHAFAYPRPQRFKLSNGAQVLFYNTPEVDKIDLLIGLKPKHYHDGPGRQGLGAFVADLLLDGAGEYDTTAFALKLESHGMEMTSLPGHISLSMLSDDFEEGLDLLFLVLSQARFDTRSAQQVRERMISDLQTFWDEPKQFVAQLMREAVYRDHPYAKPLLGCAEDVQKLTVKQLKMAYPEKVTPSGATIAIVGNLAAYDVEKLVERKLGSWTGASFEEISFPVIKPVEQRVIQYPINRDQVVLAFGGLSVKRLDPRFDALLLFDQLFGGGVLGTMSSRLFQIREATGLFYGISGSLLAGAHQEPGMVYVRTMVSNDRLEEAQKALTSLIAQGAASLTQEELGEAQRALVSSIVDNFATNKHIASTFVHMATFGFADDYYDHRADQLNAYTRDEVVQVVDEFLQACPLVELQIGRV